MVEWLSTEVKSCHGNIQDCTANIYRIFEKNSIETDLLIKISTVLNHNCFQYLDNQTLGITNGHLIEHDIHQVLTHLTSSRFLNIIEVLIFKLTSIS